jgi:hypothetical protein
VKPWERRETGEQDLFRVVESQIQFARKTGFACHILADSKPAFTQSSQ